MAKKVKGWLDELPEAKNGIEGTMGGLTDIPFRHNGAWGGAWENGGSLPGSVGFTYARTKGIPSEGPYAKKTLPSAENGMSFYQHGLDWKPKTISRDGSTTPIAQAGRNIGESTRIDIPVDKEFLRRVNQMGVVNAINSEYIPKQSATISPYQDPDKYKKAVELQKKKNYASSKPNVRLNNRGDLETINVDRDFEGRAISPNAKRFDKGLDHINTGIETAGAIMGVGQIGSNLLRLGVSQLEKQIGRNLVSKAAKNFTSRINPVLTSLDEAASYAQLDPIGIMGNRLNSQFYNPTTALNTANNTVTGVNRNLTNSAIEAVDFVAGDNNLRNITVPKPTSAFKSEIDWGKWNPETPKYPELIDEYNAIEESTKKAGTWMKNPDGSTFQGTPEQFIQQQSSYFKKAYPEGFETTYRGGDVNNKLRTNYLKNSDVVFTTSDDYGAQVYNRIRNPYISLSKTEAPPRGITQLYMPQTSNKLTIDGANQFGRRNYARLNVTEQNPKTLKELKILDDFKTFMKENHPDVDLSDRVMTDHFADFLNSPKGKSVDRVEFKKIIDGTIDPIDVEVHNLHNKKQLKSMWGNVGFFDMTNPNIYKAIVPAAIGTTALGAMEQKRKGGIIKDDRGQWAHPGEITQISSPNITMQGVSYPVLGIGADGEEILMQPGEDYKFRKAPVTEIPLMQKGGFLPKAQSGNSIQPFYKDEEDRKRYQQALTDFYNNEIKGKGQVSVKPYLAKDRSKIIDPKTGEYVTDDSNTCIDGVCGIMEKAGKKWNAGTVNGHYIGNETFHDAVYGSYDSNKKTKTSPKEDAYAVTGNFQVGDIVQASYDKGKNRFKPSDAKIIVAIEKDENGNDVYITSGGSGGDFLGGSPYTKDQLKDLIKSGDRKVTRPGYLLDKDKLEKNRITDPEALQAIAEREKMMEYETGKGFVPWQYSLRGDATDVNNINPYVNSFMSFANNPKKVEELAKKLKVPIADVHDELLNTFGELGQETKFGTSFTPEVYLENLLRDPNLSIGPGQIRFSSIDSELKNELDINSVDDLYDGEKLIPLMTAMNVRNRKYLKGKGEKLSEDLMGVPGVDWKNIKHGIGRWTPYVYQSSRIDGPKNLAKRKLIEESWFENNPSQEEIEEFYNADPRRFKKLFDEDSYANKVFGYIDRNLQRVNPKLLDLKELPEVEVSSKKKFKNGGWLDEL